MDVQMVDQPADRTDPLTLLEEDELRQIARHVKSYIPGNSNGDINEESTKLISLLEKVLTTCSSNTLNAGHRVAAWNALCALIDQTIDCKHEAVRLILWQAQIWNESLRLYLDQSHNARPKSSKQLLGSLSNVLRKSEGAPWIGELKSELSLHLVAAVSAREVNRDSKAYLLLFTHFLAKKVISLEKVLEKMGEVHHIPESKAQVQVLLSLIFQWTARGDFGSIIGQLISVILDKLDQSSTSTTSHATSEQQNAAPIWSDPLHETLGRSLENTEAYRSHIFPVLFKRSLPQYATFLKQLGIDQIGSSEQSSSSNNSREMLFAALQTGKNLGLVEETKGSDIVLGSDRVLIPIQLITALISSDDRSARLTGLSLLISSLSPTKPFEPAALELLKGALPHLHVDTDAFFRSELFSLSQRMFDRMRAATATLVRNHAKSNKSLDASESLADHKEFLNWYLRFITWELRPTSNYQRHISALKCLALLLRSGVDASISQESLSKSATGNAEWPFKISVVEPGLHRLLLDLLMDPYDDVRQTSASILELCAARDTQPANTGTSLEYAKERAITKMLSSGRADHADGVAYMHGLSHVTAANPEEKRAVLTSLLDKTEEMLQIVDREMARAVDQFPLHGLLTSLRYVLLRCTGQQDLYEGLHERVQSILQHVWSVVKPTLCDDAPEGHVPDEMDDVPDITSKDILSYCWRALKEESLLMGTMLSPAILKTCKSSAESKHTMFELCFVQLSELRHRGAFSTVAQTWTTCCSLMENDTSPLGLSTWYKRTINLLQSSLTINTRRSAGLPSLLCGVLIADRSGALFMRAFAELERISREVVAPDSAQEGSLPQVHAMNCMKDILKNTRLAEKSEQYVPVALRLAADSLRSEAWAIRNCGLMLFRAVIDRLLGTNDAYVEDEVATKRRVDFEHHHDLLELVIGLLSTTQTSDLTGEGARNEGVFPALQLLQRAQMPESKRAEVQKAVFALTRSPSWHVRDKAARTYVSFVPAETTANVLEGLLTEQPGDHNALHGALLCAMYLIRRLNAKVSALDTNVPECGQLATVAGRCKASVEAAEWLRKDESCMYTSINFVDVEASMAELDRSISTNASAQEFGLQGFSFGSSITLEGDRVRSLASGLGHLLQAEAMGLISGQTEADLWLEQRALHIERQVAEASSMDTSLFAALEGWAHATQTALNEESIFSRQAVVQGLSNLRRVWPHLTQQSVAAPLFRQLCCSVYDLLNDDDEDVRIEAAQTACKILTASGTDSKQAQTTSLVPLVAAQKLAKLMVDRWPDSPGLFEHALARAFSGTGLQSVESELQSLDKDEYALFAEEKQNLYIDDAREVRMWSKVAMSLSPIVAQGQPFNQLTRWAFGGLQDLKAKFESSEDGPLGWTTSDKAFLLGLQVVHATEVLLSLAAQGATLPIEAPVLSEALVALLRAAEGRGGNILWVREVERIVSGVVSDGSSGKNLGYSWQSV